MATIKSYTTIEQSRKLANIIPNKSADMCWGIDSETLQYNCSPYPCAWKNYTAKQYYVPCWSLAALLSILPNGIIMNKDSQNGKYHFYSKYIGTYVTADNPIDACYDMILKLNEQKLI